MLLIDTQSDNQVPIVAIDPRGDVVLGLRLLGFDQGGQAAQNKTEGKPLARFRVSSAILQKACPTTVMDPTVMAMLPTESPLLWTHMDNIGNLSLLIKSQNPKSSMYLRQQPCLEWALETLMEILHLTRKPEERFVSDCATDEAVIIAFVADIAWALNCIGPVVPWINLWLTRVQLRSAASALPEWHYTWQWPCVGIVVGFTMGDATAFERCSMMCIRHGCGSGNDGPFDHGLYVCDLVYSKLYIYPTVISAYGRSSCYL